MVKELAWTVCFALFATALLAVACADQQQEKAVTPKTIAPVTQFSHKADAGSSHLTCYENRDIVYAAKEGKIGASHGEKSFKLEPTANGLKVIEIDGEPFRGTVFIVDLEISDDEDEEIEFRIQFLPASKEPIEQSIKGLDEIKGWKVKVRKKQIIIK